MRKLIFAIMPTLLLSCTAGYTISGTAPEGVDSVNLRISDTAIVVNETKAVTDGTFCFTGKLEDLSRVSIFMRSGEQISHRTSFAMFNEDILVKVDTASRGGLSVEGNTYGMKVDELTKKVYDSESEDTPFLVIDSLLSANPADETVPFLFSRLVYYLNLQQYDAIMEKVDPSMKNSKYFVAQEEHFECLRKTAIGQQFTDFTCPLADGQLLQLSSIAGKGTWLFVDFWASWCGPCRRENPNVVAAYRKFHDKGFDILGVSLDSDAAKWAAAIETDSLTWTHVSDLKMWDSPARFTYGINSIPANILIGPDGVIAARNLYGEKLEEFLSEKLN